MWVSLEPSIFPSLPQQVEKVEPGGCSKLSNPPQAPQTLFFALVPNKPGEPQCPQPSTCRSQDFGFRGQRHKLNFLERKIEMHWLMTSERAVRCSWSQGGSEYNFRKRSFKPCSPWKGVSVILLWPQWLVQDGHCNWCWQLLSILHMGFSEQPSTNEGQELLHKYKNFLTLSDCVVGLNLGTKFKGVTQYSGFDAIFLKNQN